ncbi:family 10 glycosylhydrolase [Streptomyces litchfieldiae]|uniref:Family 10 glycosylhydrolase n=1 Tax=Streptomyces litchfieldiae TaxID=3075543 RepID=A0ABU2MJL2_9ACTN|nr:family 10 glycosylhydrolase [Streptomyces sp. DSM 44938]MDT0341123.1 family 10 glycosylhydrolase [Streptomyces sp. DSM 44938]
MRRILPTLLACLALLCGSLAAAAPAQAEDNPPEQWRSYWVDAFNAGIYTPDQVSTLIDDALAVNANAVIVQTARRYDCFCNRALYPRTDAAVDPAPYDPLDEVIAQAHAAGLEVHAWVNVNTMWNSTTPPRSPDHVFNQHGPTAQGAGRWLNKKADGTELVGANAYVDPGHPDAVEYIVSAIRSIVAEYDVDGINLDYIRYPDGSAQTTHSDWGYNDVSLARFQRATGRTDIPAPADPQWSDWRRDQVTNLVRRVYLGIWEEDPGARLSMDAITYGFGPQSVGGWESTRTYAEVLQDWAGWLDEGIMDTVVTMNYKRNWNPDQARMFAEWSEFLADAQGERQAVNGPALYLNSVADSVAQANLALTPTAAGNTAAGWSGYSYANPSMDVATNGREAERQRLAEALTTGPDAPFAEEAAVPDMVWKSAPSDGHVTGELALRDGTPLDGAEVTLIPLWPGGERHTQRADGSGWFGFAHVPPGRYLARVDLPDGVAGVPLTTVRVRRGDIAEADFPALHAPR